MSEEVPDSQARNREILAHYSDYLGQPNRVWTIRHSSKTAPTPLYVAAFAPQSVERAWTYASIGMSSIPMAGTVVSEHRVELLAYSIQEQPGLVDTLSQLAIYPFAHSTHFAPGHTIAGMTGKGVVEGSPLTEILLTPVYFEAAGFDVFSLSDMTHVQVLWLTPLYYSERMYACEHGWQKLVQDVFIEQEVQPADLWRPCAVG